MPVYWKSKGGLGKEQKQPTSFKEAIHNKCALVIDNGSHRYTCLFRQDTQLTHQLVADIYKASSFVVGDIGIHWRSGLTTSQVLTTLGVADAKVLELFKKDTETKKQEEFKLLI